MPRTLSSRWWALLIRGLAAIAFGILTFIHPGVSLLWLVLLFGAYAFVDGVFELVAAVRSAEGGGSWGALVFRGLVGIAVGLYTFFSPGITALALLFIIAAWAVITGFSSIIAAIRLRKIVRGEWLMVLAGLLSVAFGVLLFVRPGVGALAVTLWIGWFAIVFGIVVVALAFRLRAFGRAPERRIPTGGTPIPV